MLFASVGRHIYSVGQHLALKEVILILLWVVHVVCGICEVWEEKSSWEEKNGGQSEQKTPGRKKLGTELFTPSGRKNKSPKKLFSATESIWGFPSL